MVKTCGQDGFACEPRCRRLLYSVRDSLNIPTHQTAPASCGLRADGFRLEVGAQLQVLGGGGLPLGLGEGLGGGGEKENSAQKAAIGGGKLGGAWRHRQLLVGEL